MVKNALTNHLTIFFVALILSTGFLCMAPVSSAEKTPQKNSEKSPFLELEEQWGIRPLTIRLTGGGHFLDFRYLVIDAEKAKPVLSRNKKAYLRDHETGKIVPVPVTKLGPMRGTTRQPKEGRQYFILFANVQKFFNKSNWLSFATC